VAKKKVWTNLFRQTYFHSALMDNQPISQSACFPSRELSVQGLAYRSGLLAGAAAPPGAPPPTIL
jgi:hypothetical protein